MKKILVMLMALVAILSLVGMGSLAMYKDTETTTATFTAGTWGPQSVLIDIKPGDSNNTINPYSNGVIKVAILSTSDFDATYVDADTVQFGPAGAVPVRWEITDSNNDLSRDMVLTFRMQDTGIRNGDTQAELTGFTLQKKQFEGVDTVRTVPYGDDQ